MKQEGFFEGALGKWDKEKVRLDDLKEVEHVIVEGRLCLLFPCYFDQQFSTFNILKDLVSQEHEKQIKKWGIQAHSIFEWNTYLDEEKGELSKAISEYVYRRGSREEIVKEAIQVATLALKIAEMFNDGRKAHD